MSPDYHYSNLNMEMWLAFHDSGAFTAPTTKELIDVLDAYADKDKVGDIKVLVINGNLDFVVNTPGNMWQFDRLGWRGQDGYRSKQFQALPTGLGITGSWKATGDGRLAFVAMDGAGHFMSGDTREGFYRTLQEWLRGGWRM